MVFKHFKNFDLVFVDGRFRVACVLQTILNCKNPIILVHDYPDRGYYHIIEKYLNVIEAKNSLYVFRKKENISDEDVLIDWELYKDVPD